MKDATKKKIIHLLNQFDRLTAKGMRNGGRMSTKMMYEKHDDGDELQHMTGKELNRELRTQLLTALPVILFYVFLLTAFVFVLTRF